MSKNNDQNIVNLDNIKIINEFDLLIKDIEYKINNNLIDDIGKYKFKLKHFKNSLKIIKKFPKKIKKGEDLKDYDGIGKGTISRIDEIINNNSLSEINNSKIKDVVKEMNLIKDLSEIINIGSKIAKDLIDNFNIISVDDLKYKVNNNLIEVNDKIKIGLKYHNKVFDKIPRSEIDEYNIYLQKLIKNLNKDMILIIAGSYRREKNISNDIDILLTHKTIKTNKEYDNIDENYLELFIKLLKKNKIIVDDLTDIDNKTKYMGFSKLPRKKIRRIDIRFVPFNYYYSALLYFTGSYQLNTKMRKIAKDKGYKLNEYGLFKKKNNKYENEPINVNSEEDIFNILDIDYIEPKNR